MAKKKSEHKGTKGEVFGVLKDVFSNFIVANIKASFDEFLHAMQQRVYYTATKLIESVLALTLLVLGMIMILISLPFLLSYYVDLPVSMFALVIGFLLLIISILAFDRIHKTRFKED